MTLLRIRASLTEPALHCSWALIAQDGVPLTGEGPLTELPRGAGRVQLLIPAAQALLVRARVPAAARKRAGSALAFAVEEQTLGEPDQQQASWLGAAEGGDGDEGALAVVDKTALRRWREALAGVGLGDFELHCETLLLPWEADEWSLAWDGDEGFVRCGAREGVATDRGGRDRPPLALRLLLEEARTRGVAPAAIALYATRSEALPDTAAWQDVLGVPLRHAGAWDWRAAPRHAGIALMRERRSWPDFGKTAARLRPAALMLGCALALHAGALTVDWMRLAGEQRELRRNMEARFRAVFPEAVAVVDPALQMQRKLAEARHGAGMADEGDFLPMIERVAPVLDDLPAGSLRALSYENGRLTLEFGAVDEAAARRIGQGLVRAGLSLDATSPSQSQTGTLILTVRAS